MLGNGPVRPVGIPDGRLAYTAPSDYPLNAFRGSTWGGNKVLWAVGPTVMGDVLIRGHQVDGPGEVRFGMAIEPDAELVLSGGARGAAPEAAGWRGFPNETRMQGPGCYAYQIDTESTSTVIVFAAETPVPGS